MRRLFLILVFVWGIALAADFTDIAWHPYEESVRYLENAWVVKGYPDGSFGVDRAMTRAEMMKIIIEAKGQEQEQEQEKLSYCFDDVKDERYAPYICYASKEKMIKGIGDGLFWPNNNVTIAEGLKIAINVFGGHGVVEWKGDDWYQPFVDWSHDNTIFSKYAIYPYQAMTRGQMAYLTHQLMLEKASKREFANKRKIGSLGCGLDKPSSAPTEFVVDGVERHAITDIPSSYDSDKPTQLIIAWHGRTNSNSEVRSYYKVSRNAPNAIVVYPAWLPEAWPSRSWSPTSDVIFFDTIVQEMSQKYCINQDQIDIMGHSLGGWWTNTLACMRGDLIRGIWSVGGSVTRKECTGPVAAMIMHHPDDNLASYAGGIWARDRLLQQNHCDINSATPVRDAPAKSHCVQYECMADAPVIWCPHTEDDTRWYYYPHTWPSFATKMITDFWKDL